MLLLSGILYRVAVQIVIPSTQTSVLPYAKNTEIFPTMAVGANWETYTNQQFGYSLLHPKDADISSGKYSSGGENDFLYATDIRLHVSTSVVIPAPIEGYLVTVTAGDFIAPEKGDARLTKAVDVANHYHGTYSKYNKVTPITTTSIDGREAYVFTQHDAGPAGGSGNGYDWVRYFVDNGKGNIVMIDVICDSLNKQNIPAYRKIANTIVSTLRLE